MSPQNEESHRLLRLGVCGALRTRVYADTSVFVCADDVAINTLSGHGQIDISRARPAYSYNLTRIQPRTK